MGGDFFELMDSKFQMLHQVTFPVFMLLLLFWPETFHLKLANSNFITIFKDILKIYFRFIFIFILSKLEHFLTVLFFIPHT